MIKYIIFCLLIFSGLDSSFALDRYVIRLTDKNNSPYSITNPSAYLSAKAIARRAAHNIPVDQTDFPVNPAYITGIANTGALVLSTSKWLNTVTVYTTDPLVVSAIQALPYVLNLSTVGKQSMQGQKDNKLEQIPLKKHGNPYVVAKTSGFDYGLATNQIHMMNGEVLHNAGYRGENMTIAVLDAGFLNVDTLVCFDSLKNQNRLLGTRDFVVFDNDVYQDDAHGAMVLSLMAADLPGQIIGTAPKASYWLLRSEDAGSEYIIEEYNWATAAEFADSAGVDLINTSLGYSEFWDASQNHTYADLDGNTTPVSIAADIAASKGILVECSAGNEGNNPWNYILAPADADSVLTTGAVNDSGFYAGFSSNGPTVDGRVKPNVACQGAGAYVYLPWGGGVAPGNGTSFSGPIMTGMAACLWQAFPGMSNMQIIHAIEQSASQYQNPDTLLGYGIPDFAYAKTLLTIQESGGNFQSDQIINFGPNPFSDVVTFNFFSNTRQRITVELLDLHGKRVVQNQYTFDAKSLNKIAVVPNTTAKGVYILRINTNEGNFSERVIRD